MCYTICYLVRDPTWNDINRVSCSSSTCQVVEHHTLHLLVVQMHGKSALLLNCVKEVNPVCTIRAELSQSQTKPKPSAREVRATVLCVISVCICTTRRGVRCILLMCV